MTRQLKHIWIIIRNVIILFLILEVSLSIIYSYKSKKEYDNYIALKIDAQVHGDMKPEDVKELYYEYLNAEMKWTPYVHFSPKYFNGKYNTIDSFGRRKTTQYSNNKNAIKIFCFGGSTMYGIGATDETTIPSLLSLLLSNKFPNTSFDITNFGIGGYTRDQENIQLQQELLKGNIPDIVIFYDGVNEVLSGFQNNSIGIPQNASNRQLEFNTSKNYGKKISMVLKSSYTNRLIKYLKGKLNVKKHNVQTSQLSKKIVFNYFSHTIYTDALSKKYNFKVFNFLQPTIFTKKHITDFEHIMKKNDAHLKEIYSQTYQIFTRDTLMQKKAFYINISDVFDDAKTTVYTDFCHTAKKGNEIIAREIFLHLKASNIRQKKDSL